LNFGEINNFNNMADMDFNFNVDDMGIMVDDAPLIPNGPVGGTPGPQQRSKAAKVDSSLCAPNTLITHL